jgi:hypothetical protein
MKMTLKKETNEMTLELQAITTEPLTLTGSLGAGLSLRHSLPTMLERHPDHIIIACESLNVYGYGETEQEAEADLRRNLARLYDSYARAESTELTQGGRELADKLRATVTERG